MPGLFRLENRNSEQAGRIYARYEILHTLVDFTAAILFLVGSALFFWKSTEDLAIWLFIFGSIAFAVKPTLRLFREIELYRLGDMEDLAHRDGH